MLGRGDYEPIMPARRAVLDRSTLAFALILAAVTTLRVSALFVSPLDLHFDEAQYWAWSRDLAWGYFSKPPLIAWTIAFATDRLGDSEWAVRIASPLAHACGALALFALGRSMYGAAAGVWAGLAWLTLPAVWLSSALISTDALVLPLWSLALLALWRLTVKRSWFWTIVLGLALGAGALAKYAMLYFVMCAALAAWWTPPVRKILYGAHGLVAALIAAVLIAPNLYWNFTNSFATIAHTASNASYDGDLVHPAEALEFLFSQAAVIGPLLFAALLWLLWRAGARASGLADEDRFLLAFVLPPLVIILAQAFLSRANANWAAAAYPAAIVWIVGSISVGKRGRRFLAAALAVNTLIGALILGGFTYPQLTDGFRPAANSVKRLRAWEDTAREIATRAAVQPGEPPYTAVLVDHRATYYELAYYWRHARRSGAPLPPVRMWVLHGDARNSAEATDPMRPEEGARVLVVHASPDYLPFVAGDFTVFRTVDHISVPLGAGITRELEISVGENFSPAPRDAAFAARLRGE